MKGQEILKPCHGRKEIPKICIKNDRMR